MPHVFHRLPIRQVSQKIGSPQDIQASICLRPLEKNKYISSSEQQVGKNKLKRKWKNHIVSFKNSRLSFAIDSP